jgi:hypothetical protein
MTPNCTAIQNGDDAAKVIAAVVPEPTPCFSRGSRGSQESAWDSLYESMHVEASNSEPLAFIGIPKMFQSILTTKL